MKNIIFTILILFVFFACKRVQIPPENTYIGTWEVVAIYMNGGNYNWLSTIATFPHEDAKCLSATPTLEFTENLIFDLQTDCDWLRAAGSYTFDNVSITATDTLNVSQHTQIFTFENGFLSKIAKIQSFTFDLKFRKKN